MISLANLNNLNRTAQMSGAKPWYANPTYALNSVMPSLIHDYTQSKYYNSASGATGFPFTATRTTNAMQFNAAGQLVYGPHQLCTRGETISSWSMGTDGTVTLSGNTAPTGSPSYLATWTTPLPSSGCQLGGQTAELGTAALGGFMTYSIYLRYVNHDWVRVVMYSSFATSNQVRCWVNLQTKTIHTIAGGGSATALSASITDVGDGWVRVTLSGHASWTNILDNNLLFATCQGDNNSTRVGDGATVEVASAILESWSPAVPQSWRPEFNTTGSVWYGPREDYDPATGQPLGLLSEPAVTNDIDKSLNMKVAGVTAQAGSTANGDTYLGGWSSVRYTADGTSAPHFAFAASVTPGASQTRAVAVIFKNVDAPFLQITPSANYPLDPNNTYININPSTGTITQVGSAVSAEFIQHLGGGVYYAGLTFTTQASPSGGTGCVIGVITSGTSPRLISNTSTASFDFIYAFNGVGSGRFSPIPTFGTAVSKAADIFSTSSVSWVNLLGGTFYVNATRLTAITGGSFVNLGDSGGTTNRNQFRWSANNVGHIITSAGVVQSTAAAAISIANGNIKAAYRYSAGNQSMAANGTITVTDGNITTLPAAQTTFMVGQLGSSSEKFGGWIKEVRYYGDYSASNAQLQTLTTP